MLEVIGDCRDPVEQKILDIEKRKLGATREG
jgi:hypothetical protein